MSSLQSRANDALIEAEIHTVNALEIRGDGNILVGRAGKVVWKPSSQELGRYLRIALETCHRRL